MKVCVLVVALVVSAAFISGCSGCKKSEPEPAAPAPTPAAPAAPAVKNYTTTINDKGVTVTPTRPGGDINIPGDKNGNVQIPAKR